MTCLYSNLTCFNGAYCEGNSCHCSNECFFGNQCQLHFNIFELPMTSAMLQDTLVARVCYIISFILLATIGLVNNSFALATFIRERIRITVCGVYLIIFCLCNLILMLLIYTNIITLLHYDNDIYGQWHCFVVSYICTTLAYVYIWMSVAIIIEKVLIECLNYNMFGSKLRAIIISFLIIICVSLSNLPEIYTRVIRQDLSNRLVCSYDTKKHHQWSHAQYIISYFHSIIPCVVHLISIICILTTIARRKIFIGGCNENSQQSQLHRVWFEQLYIHRDFFIPPLSIIICILPHAIVHYILLPTCMRDGGIVLMRLHIALVLLIYVPAMLPFIIHVYTNKRFLEEFKQTNIYRYLCCRKEKNHEQQIRRWSNDRFTEINENR